MPTAPHRAREVAESFGTDPDRYDRTRPHYPDAMIDAIVAAAPGPELLDVGIGTGIAALQFQRAGCEVLGVEVDERMAEFARTRHGLAVEVAPFEHWDAAGRTFDAVVSGQTWHWVDPVAGAEKAARILRPHGRLALFWNVFDPPPELAREFAEVYRRTLPDLPFTPWARPALEGYETIVEKAEDGIEQAFGAPERWRYDWEQAYTRDEWLDQLPTHGGHSRVSPAQLAEIVAGIGTAIDKAGGSFTMRYATVVLTAAR
jgi:SAM-dependent methyltransferase